MPKKYQTNYPGVRYYTHGTRLFNRKPDQYYSIRYRTANGVRHEEGIGWATKGWTAKKAHEILSLLESNITSGQGPQTLKEIQAELTAQREFEAARMAEEALDTMTFKELADKYLQDKQAKKSVAADRTRLQTHLLPALGSIAITEMHHGHINMLKAGLEEKKLAPATIKQCLILIRALYNYAKKTPRDPADPDIKLFKGTNPFDGYEGVPAFNNRRETWFTEEQAQRILEALENEHTEFRDYVILGMYTGMRRGEIASITEANIAAENNAIILGSDQEKNAEGRVVFVPEDVMGMLKSRLTGDPDRHIFQIHPDTVSHKFSALMKQLGLQSKNRRISACFHTLRHTLITHLVRDRLPLNYVQSVSGHKNFEMVLRYAKAHAPEARQAVSEFHRKMASSAPSPGQSNRPGGEQPANG